jgi:E3 ubiquitin-protein ligase RFWD2
MLWWACLQVVAQLSKADPAILSSIEFSTEARFFATAGVSRMIRIYDFDAVMSNPHVETHCPNKELKAMGKLSCVSWNKYGSRARIGGYGCFAAV